MKYYICELTTNFGEYETNTAFRFELQDDLDELDYAESIAKIFWGEMEEEVDGAYYYKGTNREIVCWVDFVKEISSEVYEALNGIITKLQVEI